MFFCLLGLAWVKGYDFVKSRDASQLPKFYMLLACVRFILISTLVLFYVLLSDDWASMESFAIMVMVMYVLMMTVTLTLKH